MDPQTAAPLPPDRGDDAHRDALLVLSVALVGHLPALGAFWNRDDWGLLAHAAGLVEGDGAPWRFVSRDLWWRLLYPVFGTAVDPWTWARLGLHAAAAWLVLRLARRAGLGGFAALAAGLVFAASPLAFTPLYWASGVQELLGAVLALLAVERFCAGGRAAIAVGLGAGLLAVFAKENALLLGPFVVLLALGGDPARRRVRLLAAAGLSAAAALEAAWLWRGLPHGPGTGLLIDPLGATSLNLARCGWWLASPTPASMVDVGLPVALGGLSVWALWAAWSRLAWWRGNRVPALALGAGLLSLLPALGVEMGARPWLAYLAAAPAALTVTGALLGARGRPSTRTALGLALVAIVVAGGLAELRLTARDADGRPADPLVLSTAVSHDALRTLNVVAPETAPKVALLQIAGISTPARSGLAASRTAPLPSTLYTALDGDLAQRVAGDPRRRVDWVRWLDDVTLDSTVFVDAGDRLLWWGPLPQALVYQTLALIALDRQDEAVHTLGQAMRNSRPTMPFVFDVSQLPVPPARVRTGARAFLARIRTADALRDDERDAVLATARELLTRCGVAP